MVKEGSFLTTGNVLLQGGALCILLFGLKEEWEYALDAIAEVPSAMTIFLMDEEFKEDDLSLEGGDGVTKFEVILVFKILHSSDVFLMGVIFLCLLSIEAHFLGAILGEVHFA